VTTNIHYQQMERNWHRAVATGNGIDVDDLSPFNNAQIQIGCAMGTRPSRGKQTLGNS
jgi:hypothetical protein